MLVEFRFYNDVENVTVNPLYVTYIHDGRTPKTSVIYMLGNVALEVFGTQEEVRTRLGSAEIF